RHAQHPHLRRQPPGTHRAQAQPLTARRSRCRLADESAEYSMLRSVLLLLSLIPAFAQAGSTLRCGSQLISTGDLAGEVRAKCGEPVDVAFLGYREVTDYYGLVNQVAVEEWIYGPKN